MISVTGYQIFAVFVFTACTIANGLSTNPHPHQQGTVSARSSTSISDSGVEDGSMTATTYNGPETGPLRAYHGNVNVNYTIPTVNTNFNTMYTYLSYLQHYIANLQQHINQEIQRQREQMAAALARPPSTISGGASAGGYNVNGAFSGGSTSPQGGSAEAGLITTNPAAPNIPNANVIEGGTIPPATGSFQGVFSSSSSSSSSSNGEQTSSHQSAVGVNNGDGWQVYSSHNP